ncbi:MAG: Glu-tRNA(Gln) amidotransferase subunit GatE [Candidatus Diapherotrites archaeon]|nr:Glu-tRNA(Gln) amidotransferase subunit GatE [Candidatus Diapherotrites archaeon]
MDYKGIGFKAGIEIHQQLATAEKLFCHCRNERSEELPLEFRRRLRAVAGELGEVDAAARHEMARGREFVYRANPETSCLVELDEAPPDSLNAEALEATLQFSRLVNASPLGEAHVMRKTVVDGSNTSGFQRTVLVAGDGFVETSKGRVRLPTVMLEEDSATVLEKRDGVTVYRLDRLGVPLIEVTTEPDVVDPDHLHETAKRLGLLLRATGSTKRGIGTIRQDLNISVRGGARVEIKGSQDLKMFPKIAEIEAGRQLSLIGIRDELLKRKAAPVNGIVDVSDLFEDSDCRFCRGKDVFAVLLRGFGGFLGREVAPGRRLGTEFSDYAKVAGVGGIIHSDEDMGKYRINELEAVRKRLGCDKDDAVVMVVAPDRVARPSLKQVLKRARMALDGVPREVRNALPDGTTSFMRPMPGSARLYPETDLEPIVLRSELLQSVPLPELPEETLKRLRSTGMGDELADKVFSSRRRHLFDVLFEKHKKEAKLIASTVEDVLPSLRRKGVDVPDDEVIAVFEAFFAGRIPKDSIPNALRLVGSGKSLNEAVSSFAVVGEEDVARVVRDVVAKNPHLEGDPKAFQKLMGDAMKALKGKADGSVVARLLRKELR